jgi:hypothetical protein
MNQKIRQVASYLGLLSLTILLAVGAILYLINFWQSKNEVSTPAIDTPPAVEQPATTTTSSLKKVALIKPEEKYNISQNPYTDRNIYNQKSRQLALIGDFKTAILEVKGALPNNDNHFLSINVGAESGIYNAVRSSASSINLQLTQNNLGVFNNNSNPLNLKIDLMAWQTLAPTKKEFLATNKSTKLTRFWDSIKPKPPAPSITKILVFLFNEKGIYTGTIQELNFLYSCKKVDGCKAHLCSIKPSSKCIKENFGEEAYKEYIEKIGVNP